MLAPFRITVPYSVPAAEREMLLTSLQTYTDVQQTEHKDPSIDAIIAIIKETGAIADAVVSIATLSTMMYGWVKALRARGLIPDVTLFRPNQPELNLSQVHSAEEIEAWLQRLTR